MAQGFRRKWKNFFRIPAVKITTKVFSTIFKCILTIFLIGVITASMVGCVLVVYVVTSFDVSESVPDLDSISLNQSSSILVKDQATGEFVEHQRVEGSKMVWKDLTRSPSISAMQSSPSRTSGLKIITAWTGNGPSPPLSI